MGNGLMTSKETFQHYDTASKLETLFDFVKAIHDKQCMQPGLCADRMQECDKRISKIERRKYWDKGIAGTTGFIGGIIGGLLRRLI